MISWRVSARTSNSKKSVLQMVLVSDFVLSAVGGGPTETKDETEESLVRSSGPRSSDPGKAPRIRNAFFGCNARSCSSDPA